MNIVNDLDFDCPNTDAFSALQVFQVFPNIFNDERGYFTEVIKDQGKWPCNDIPLWFSTMSWIRQVNRSSSLPMTIRGCHAQAGKFCQGKLVEALSEKIYDIITDARPDSKTFGFTKIYVLDPIKQNKLWVPRGFLHAFVVPNVKSNAVFLYFCDNTYSKESEIGINPNTLLPKIISLYKETKAEFNDLYEVFENEIVMSEKDKNNLTYEDWMASIKSDYLSTKRLWYK